MLSSDNEKAKRVFLTAAALVLSTFGDAMAILPETYIDDVVVISAPALEHDSDR